MGVWSWCPWRPSTQTRQILTRRQLATYGSWSRCLPTRGMRCVLSMLMCACPCVCGCGCVPVAVCLLLCGCGHVCTCLGVLDIGLCEVYRGCGCSVMDAGGFEAGCWVLGGIVGLVHSCEICVTRTITWMSLSINCSHRPPRADVLHACPSTRRYSKRGTWSPDMQ